ncbi:Down syndrome cell adhesion molecule-like protein [Armadillidium vulgare]|nr:Down syndrome cell adhesion molecule-like protein [Armadillidium vulgare]
MDNSIEIENLIPFTDYSLSVQAVNRNGNGPLSEEVFAATLEDVPSTAPLGISCSPMTSKSLLISWDSLTEREARGRLLGFKVLYFGESPEYFA